MIRAFLQPATVTAIILFFFTGIQIFAQQSKLLKLYSNFNYIKADDNLSTSPSNNNLITTEKEKGFELGYFSPALNISLENGNSHEFELSRFKLDFSENETILTNDSLNRVEIVDGTRKLNSFIAIRYEYGLSLKRSEKESKLHPYLGLSIQPYFQNYMETPIISNRFPTSTNQFGALLSITPRINYNLKGNWYLDLNVPIQVYDFNVSLITEENPINPVEERTTTEMNLNIFPYNILLRLGVGIRI